MMNDKHSQPPAWLALTQSGTMDASSSSPLGKDGMHFDGAVTFSDLKKWQDPAKFNKARFEFRLYRRP